MRLSSFQKKNLKALIREIVLLRDKACLVCGNPEFQVSHIYSVGAHKRMEYDPENCKALCVRHHLYWWHKNPVEAHEWLLTALPRERLERLKLKSQEQGKTGFDYELHVVYLKNEIKKLKNKEGYISYI